MAGETLMPDGVTRVRAPNPSPLTLDGTNTYLVSGWVVDPGPDDAGHLDAVVAAAAPRGIEGIVLTHSHGDHSDGAPALAARAGVDVVLPEGAGEVGPFTVIPTPGHAPDHVSLLHGRVLFAGDTVLGEGSVFVGGGDGSMAAYLDSLRRLLELDLEAILPGHGPVVWEPRAKLEEYLAHRLERERRGRPGRRAAPAPPPRGRARARGGGGPPARPHLRSARAAAPRGRPG